MMMINDDDDDDDNNDNNNNKAKELYWRNRLLKNRVGTCRLLIFFLHPAVCPFIHTYPVYTGI